MCSSPSSPQDTTEDPYRLVNPYSPAVVARRRKRQRRTAAVLGGVLAVLLVALVGFFVWDALRPVDYGAYATQEITIGGLTDEPFTITPDDLAQMDCERSVSRGTGQGQNGASKAGVVASYGPTLAQFLEQYDCEPTDFRRIKFTCKDGYIVILRGETLSYDIIMSIASGKDALYEVQQPLRLVIPDEQSGKWAYGVVRIDFTR